MKKIIAAIDGSSYLESICDLAIWVAKKSSCKISLLHVASPHYEAEAFSDLSGSIGVDARSELLEQLTKIDEKRGKEEQQKGKLILQKALDKTQNELTSEVETLHRRGSFAQTIKDLETQFDILILGKSGEHSETFLGQIGANIEQIARQIRKPILVASKKIKQPKKLLFAYDGSEIANSALNFICENDLLKNLECHIIKVCEKTAENEKILNEAGAKLNNSGFNVISFLQSEIGSVDKLIMDYAKKQEIDMLAIGAFGHSKIRNFFLGSVTVSLLENSEIPVLMLR